MLDCQAEGAAVNGLSLSTPGSHASMSASPTKASKGSGMNLHSCRNARTTQLHICKLASPYIRHSHTSWHCKTSSCTRYHVTCSCITHHRCWFRHCCCRWELIIFSRHLCSKGLQLLSLLYKTCALLPGIIVPRPESGWELHLLGTLQMPHLSIAFIFRTSLRGSNNGTSPAAQQYGSSTNAHRMLSNQVLMLVKSRMKGWEKQPAK